MRVPSVTVMVIAAMDRVYIMYAGVLYGEWCLSALHLPIDVFSLVVLGSRDLVAIYNEDRVYRSRPATSGMNVRVGSVCSRDCAIDYSCIQV